MNSRFSLFAPAVLAGALSLLSACGPGDQPPPPPDGGTGSSVAAADPRLSKVSVGSSSSLANGTDTAAITVIVKHRTGQLLSGQTVTVEVSGSGNILTQPSEPTNSEGMARATLRSTVVETKTITVKVTNSEGTEVLLKDQPTVTFEPLPAVALAFETQPSDSAAAGASLGAVRLAVKNSAGETVASNVAVTLTLQSATVELRGTRTASAVAGVVEFTDLNVTEVGESYTILASAAGLPDVVSAPFTIVPAAPARLTLSGVSSSLKAGESSGILIRAHDEFGNAATNFTGLVNFAVPSDPLAELPADTAFPDDGSGFLSLSTGITLKTAGSHPLNVSLSATPAVTASALIDVGAADASTVVFGTQPMNVQTNTPFTVEVELHDAYGNLTSATMPSIVLSLVGSPANYELKGTLTVGPNDGLAVFSNLTLDNETPTGTTLQLRASAGTFTPVDSLSFSVADVTAPGPVADFAPTNVGLNEVTLSWTGPGDDGDIGSASGYVLKYSTTPITEANFATTGTVVTTGTPNAGQTETAAVTGLTRNTAYHFALRSSDSAGNHSYAFVSATTLDDPCAGVTTDDGIACTVDACDPASGAVTNTPDDSVCTEFGTSCSATTASGCAPAQQTGAVLVSEFLATPAAFGVEFIELHNPGSTALNIQGWSLENTGGAATIRAMTDPDGSAVTAVNIPAGGYLVGIVNPAGAVDPTSADFLIGAPSSTFTLADTGDGLVLRTSAGSVSDLVDFRTSFKTADPVGATDFPGATGVSTQLEPTKLTAADNDSGANWCTTFYGATSRSKVAHTRGAANGSCSALVINEVVYDAASNGTSGVDTGRTFIELAGPGGALLTGYRLSGHNADGTVTSADLDLTFDATHPARMPLDGFLVVADGSNGTSSVPNADVIVKADPQNGPDSIALYAPGAILVDAFGYGTGVTVVEGSAAPDAAPSDYVTLSHARSELSADQNDNALDFHLDPTPTPGAANTPVVPQLLSMEPNDGIAAGGTVVTITGRDFASIASLTGATASDVQLQATFGSAAPVACTVIGSTDDGRGDVTFTCTAPAGTVGAVDFSVLNPTAIGGGVSQTGGWTYTAANNETDSPAEADYCKIVHPSPSFNATSGASSGNIFGEIYEAGVTESGGVTAGIVAEVGFGPQGTDPRTQAAWRFFGAVFNIDVVNNDEYVGSFTVPTVTTTTSFSYAFRFSQDNGLNWTYCDLDGAGSNAGLTFSELQLGTMTVTP